MKQIHQLTRGVVVSFIPSKQWFIIATLSLTLLSQAAYGLGFRIPNQDAAATARGNAFVATADNPSALYYNPAGITQLPGMTAQFGAHVISVNSEYHSYTGPSADTKFEVQPVPQFYFTYMPTDSKLAYGLGVYAPFGLGLEWPDNTSFQTLSIEGRLMYVAVNPVVAWQVHPTLTVAAGPTINYSYVKLRQGIGLAPNDEFKFKGDDFDFGFTAGIRWQPHEQWSFGASYRYASTMNYEGTTDTRTVAPLTGSADTTAKIKFPQYVIAGVSYRPTPKWNIEVDVDWTDWNVLKSVTFEGTRQIFGSDVQLPLNWESSFLYELGVTRYFDNGWFASAGYFFSQNSVSERNFNPTVPDTDLHVGSLGFGRKGEHWQWAVSGQIITGPSRDVRNSQSTSLVGETANGRYKWFNQAVNFSVAYKF